LIGGNIVKIRFLNPKEIEYVRERVNSDPEFRIAAKFMSEDILFGVGDSQCIFEVRDGVATEIVLNPTPMDRWDYFIKAPEESWEKLLQPFPPPFCQGFFSAAVREDFQFGGNLEDLFAYYWATQQLISILRQLQNE
jgi:hypothetical protein